MSALFLVVAFTDIRAPVSTCVSATDATVRRAGACQAWVPQKVANACFRKSEARGEHTHLRRHDFEIQHRPIKMQEPGPDINEFVESLRWQNAIGYDFKVTEHINIQELKTIEDEIRRRTEKKVIVNFALSCVATAELSLALWQKAEQAVGLSVFLFANFAFVALHLS